MTDHTPGTPSWVDIAAPDFDPAAAFYGDLFGWTLTDPGPPEFGGYRNFLDDGKMVAGISPQGSVPSWTTYVSVVDADATAEKIGASGGTVMFAPMDVGDLGRMAICADPEGAVFGLWQAGAHGGAEKTMAPVSLCWNDLSTRALDQAKAFYSAVFGWDPQDQDMGGAVYTVWNLDGRGIGGAAPMHAQAPDDMPASWTVWFAVADRDATVARAAELGADVREPELDIAGVGRLALVADPQGALFGIIEPQPADE
jgi:predicted enzyme related to lactoylglutathione lyase